jgi:hypothetical protein
VADTPNPTPATPPARQPDPLKEKIEQALLKNLHTNNSDPEAADKDQFERSRHPHPPAKP